MKRIAIWILKNVAKKATPQLRGIFIDSVRKLELYAKGTDNPYDDILVTILKAVLELK